MVGKAQQIDDPNTKHPGCEISDLEDMVVERNIVFAVIAMLLFFVLLYYLGGANVIH
jgi:hypothetical protein